MAKRDGPCQLPARLLAAKLRRGTLSATEALEAHLARIEERNGAINAVVSLDAEGARTRAKQADEAMQHGDVWGRLHGVPMTLKDGHEVAGLRTTIGTELLDRVSDEDGTVAARLRAAGAIIIGHTNVPPWLADHQSANPIFGATHNPWNVERTAGGSSGGAAAAVAAGMTPLEVGSDMVGSIRLPAHFCGVYGLKTTEHRVPLTGFVRGPGGGPRPVRIISCLGPIARDLGDLELALGILAGPDGRDADVAPVPLEKRRRRRLAELRLAVAPTLPGATIAASLRRQVERVAEAAGGAGARIVDRLPDVEWPALNRLFGDLIGAMVGVFDPTSELRDEQRTLGWYLAALDQRDRLIATWQAYFEDVDALILPPAMTSAFSHRPPGTPFEVDGNTVAYHEQGLVHAFSNLTGLPGLAAPAGVDDDGLPIGIQIIGPLWSEMRLLDIAQALEEEGILPGFRFPP